MSQYGEGPVAIAAFDLPEWQEFMHYLYLPVRLPAHDRSNKHAQYVTLPERLAFLHGAVIYALHDARSVAPHLSDPYVYITVRRGFATPGNPLNRPGWHCDDFGGTDLNYIWSDAFPTRILRSSRPLAISEDDAESMHDMWRHATEAGYRATFGMKDTDLWIEEAPVDYLLRLSPYVIHDTPVIPEPGGMRSFFKISVSDKRYNLLGNSHNHLLDYEWEMHDRQTLRNQPQGNGDYIEEPS